MTKTSRGAISVRSIKGRLKLGFPRQWFGGEQVFLSLELPDTPDNQLVAQEKARDITIEYNKGQFDWTLDKYRSREQPVTQPQQIQLSQLWGVYCRYKSHKLKAATMRYWVKGIGRWIDRCPYQDLDLSLEIRGWLLESTTPDMAKRTLAAIGTVVDWGRENNLLSSDRNPYKRMSRDIAIEKEAAKPNAFSLDEEDRIVKAFASSFEYWHYTYLVKFWLLTGCRPSEGIGLEWEQINDACTKIRFDRSVTQIDGRLIHNKRSKTNRVRTFPCQQALTDLLLVLRSENSKGLVFRSPVGLPIYYDNFCKRAWAAIVAPVIGRKSTPYSCRDTFITQQLAAGKPIAIVARWVDNSVEIIEKTYLDISAVDELLPD